MSLQTRSLAGRPVAEIGLGCMTFSHGYGAPPDRETSRVAALIGANTVSGARYPPATQAEIDTEEFPALSS